MATKHDWGKISKEYIEASSDDVRPSLQSLAAKYGINHNYLQQRCAKEKWVEQSKIFLRRVSRESKQEKVSSLAGEQTKFDADILTVARALQGQIIGHLNEAKVNKTLLPAKDISLLSGSLSTIQRIGRTALDLDSWTPDKIINEALKLGYIITDPRDISKDGEDTPKEQVVGFSDILRENTDPAPPIATEDQQ
ncbi:MAG: hypothetical protein IM586_18165 [Pseudanabaena sp. M172S2SP2A07QC]|jgi:hypothetical protein|nr:hypothetical protein [Pseudanabaena sp. M172S2SP2A07QC]MCA6510254.1 hypothetical protein [Pseudanabaena sp. M109S1SP2A07QC]MCA6546696.1 hypothetical protein [Pseudanabaena sp. M152S2SP2A07QC]